MIYIFRQLFRDFDLCLIDFDDGKCVTTYYIADHKGLWFTTKISVPTTVTIQREVWDFSRARWAELKQLLETINWDVYATGHVSVKFPQFMHTLHSIVGHCIPRKLISDASPTHPWITPQIKDFVKLRDCAPPTQRDSITAQLVDRLKYEKKIQSISEETH